MAINEIKQVNEIYRNELLELENIQNELSSNDLNMEKDLKRPINTNNSSMHHFYTTTYIGISIAI